MSQGLRGHSTEALSAGVEPPDWALPSWPDSPLLQLRKGPCLGQGAWTPVMEDQPKKNQASRLH